MSHSPTAQATPRTHWRWVMPHYKDVIMSATASQFTSLTIVYSTVYSKHQSPASLASPSLWPTEKGWNQYFRWRHSYLSQYLYSVLFCLPNIMTTANTDVHIILTDISHWSVLELVTIAFSYIFRLVRIISGCNIYFTIDIKCVLKCTLQWRHNGRDGVSNHQPHHCLLNRLFRRSWKKTSKQGIHRSPGNSPYKWPVTRKMFAFDDVIMRFPQQRPYNADPLLSAWTNNRYTNDFRRQGEHLTSL